MFIDIIADFFPLIVVGEERESERVQPVSGFIPANITQSMTRAHLAQAYNSKIYIENTIQYVQDGEEIICHVLEGKGQLSTLIKSK